MKISLFYYSGAGNTKFIAKKVKKKLEKQGYQVDMTLVNIKSIQNFKQDADAIIIGFPVYDLAAPELVKQLVENLDSSNKPIAYFCTKAFLSVDSILELSEITSKKGYKTVAIQDLYMPATDALALFAKKNSRTEKILKSFHSKNIDKKLDGFIARMERGKEVSISKKWYSALSFLIPKKTRQAFHDQYTKYIPEFYSKKDICIECMLCVKGCPRENIRFDDGIKFGLNCDMCLSCLHHCPVDSIQLGDYTKGTVRLNKIEIK
jgi:flavodoxin/Pyruvate/2-oxoacid:ferredoxin oxidoreductase delta subunit